MQFIKNKKAKPIIIVSSLIVIAIIITVLIKSMGINLVSANEFNKILEDNKHSKIYIQDKYIYLKNSKGKFKTALGGVNRAKIYSKYPVEVYSKSSSSLIYIAVLLLLSILIALLVILRRNSNSSQTVGAVREQNSELLANNITPEYNQDISFKDVAGISSVKEDLEEIISFLKSPLKYKKLNIRMPKGLLLVGPPGVGKTLIAKAISSEANVPFFYHSGANFVHIYAGMGAKRVKELFNKAKEMAPSIIFIDEIDSVGKDRGNLNSDEREATLNQLLVEMDGFSSNAGVVVIGATNRIDVLDSALLRPGRFDRRVFIELPNIKEREQILKLYLQDKKYNFTVAEVAKLTAGFSPAALETLINEAALNAIKLHKNSIDLEDILSVKDRVIFGKKPIPMLSSKEREIQATYQATKAVVAHWLGFKTDRVGLLISININEDTLLTSKESILNLAKVELSGSVYLKQKFNDIFSQGVEDRAKAKELIKEANTNYSLIDSNSQASKLESIIEELEGIIASLEQAIEKIAKKLQENEQIEQSEIAKEIDALF